MTTPTRASVLDPFLTTRAQFDLALAAPEGQLLIDDDNQIVTNAVDRTDDPAVLITGNNNTFTNLTGATLTGTGADPSAPDAAIEISGTGNRVENQSRATITGTGGVFSSVANTDVVNDGDIIALTSGSSLSDRGFAVRLDTDSSVANTGFISAQSVDGVVRTISMGDRAVVDNAGTVEVTGRFAAAVEVGANSSVVNTGTVSSSGTLDGSGIVAAGPGTTVQNFGFVRGTSSAAQSNAFGIASSSTGDDTALIWNGGTIEAEATGGGNANAVVALGGRFVNEGTVTAIAAASTSLGDGVGAFLNRADGLNSGTIEATSVSGVAAGVAQIGDAVFDNSGDIIATGPTAAGISTADFGVVTNSGTIVATSPSGTFSGPGSALAIDGRNDFTIDNTGLVRSDAVDEAVGISALDRSIVQNSDRVEAAGNIATGIRVGADSTIVSSGVVQADGFEQGDAISAGDRATIRTGGAVEATGGFTAGIRGGIESAVTNTGLVRAAASELAQGITLGDGSMVQNDGIVEVSGNEAFGIDTGFFGSIVNFGTVSVSTTNGFGGGIFGGFGTSIENTGTVRAEAEGLGTVIGVNAFDPDFVINRGTIEAVTGTGNAAAVVSDGFQGRFENYGDLRAISTGTPIGNSVTSANAVFLFGATALNAGTIFASAESGFAVGASIDNGAQLTNTGDIRASGLDATGVGIAGTSSLDNAGIISASGPEASAVFADGGATILNSGSILAESDAGGADSIGIAFSTFSSGPKTIQNSGTIAADIAIADSAVLAGPGADVLALENSGQITGTVDLGDGVDVVRNTGVIEGDVLLGAGDDEYDGRGGVVTGIVDGGDGNDVIRGGDGDETLLGGAGNDVVAGGAGADVMDGGTHDTSVFGFDTLDYSDSPEGVQVNLGDATQSTSAPIKGAAGTGFGGHAEGDTFQNFEKVIGSAFDDFVYGAAGMNEVDLGAGNDTFDNDAPLVSDNLVFLGAGNDVARTGAGDDLVDAGSGNDWVQGEDGADRLFGGEGGDLLLGGNGADQLDGGADADALFGGADGDTLRGGSGNDLLSGGSGDDVLEGGAGNDLLLGGDGDNLFRFGPDGGEDLIVGFQAGAGTPDTVDLTAFDTILSFDDVLAIASETGSGAGVATVLSFDAATTLTFQGVQLAELNEADFLIV